MRVFFGVSAVKPEFESSPVSAFTYQFVSKRYVAASNDPDCGVPSQTYVNDSAAPSTGTPFVANPTGGRVKSLAVHVTESPGRSTVCTADGSNVQ